MKEYVKGHDFDEEKIQRHDRAQGKIPWSLPFHLKKVVQEEGENIYQSPFILDILKEYGRSALCVDAYRLLKYFVVTNGPDWIINNESNEWDKVLQQKYDNYLASHPLLPPVHFEYIAKCVAYSLGMNVPYPVEPSIEWPKIKEETLSSFREKLEVISNSYKSTEIKDVHIGRDEEKRNFVIRCLVGYKNNIVKRLPDNYFIKVAIAFEADGDNSYCYFSNPIAASCIKKSISSLVIRLDRPFFNIDDIDYVAALILERKPKEKS